MTIANKVMSSRVLQGLLLGATVMLCGCAGTPASADRTPSWLKHHVVGTRIPRVPDAKGDASSADYVVNTTLSELEDLPGVYMEKCRSTLRC